MQKNLLAHGFAVASLALLCSCGTGKKEEVKVDFIEGDITKLNQGSATPMRKKFDVIISMMVQDQIEDLEKLGHLENRPAGFGYLFTSRSGKSKTFEMNLFRQHTITKNFNIFGFKNNAFVH